MQKVLTRFSLARKMQELFKFNPIYIYIYIVVSAVGALAYTSPTSALSYQTEVTPTFTISESISLTVSSSDIIISDLAPGQSSDSNIIDVIVNTNNIYGYTLSATVGNSTYSNANLTNSTDDSSTFISLDEEASGITSHTSIDAYKWGYAFSTDSGNTWSDYKGLPLYTATAKTLKETNTTAMNDTTKFKIGAKAGANQLAGSYMNVINFAVTANPKPAPSVYYMQDVSTWAGTLQNAGDSLTAVDKRDGNSYIVTKLADGKIWMTQNLDLNLSTTTTLTSENTDLTVYGTDGYTTSEGYSQNGSIISWTPSSSTIDATSGDFSAWGDSDTTPDSADVGKWYQTGTYFASEICNYLTESCSNFQQNTPFATNGEHGAIGNYYNWSAAVASNNTSSMTEDSTDAGNSICPAGWRLPSVADDEFFTLNTLYNSGSTSSDTGLFNSPLYFTRAGYVGFGDLDNAGNYGYYWSSTVDDDSIAYGLVLSSGGVSPELNDYRNGGLSVRCVAH